MNYFLGALAIVALAVILGIGFAFGQWHGQHNQNPDRAQVTSFNDGWDTGVQDYISSHPQCSK